jgi:hypothetical protein
MSLTGPQIDAISKQVYQKFPELKGANPQVQSPGFAKAVPATEHYVVIYKSKTIQNIQRVVRVTTDARGRVVKMSTSR